MRWNCPHCSVALAIADDLLGQGWSFSKCFQCSGFALIRKSEINLIKVDQAPASQTLTAHAPAPNEASLSQGAGAVLAGAPRPVLKSSKRNHSNFEATLAETLQSIPPALEAHSPGELSDEQIGAEVESMPQDFGASSDEIPSVFETFDPYGLEHEPEHEPEEKMKLEVQPPRKRKLIAPVMIAAIAVLAVLSGLNLYQQGRILARPAREELNTSKQTIAQSESLGISEKMVEKIDEKMNTPRLAHQSETHSDRVSQTAMAPEREASSQTSIKIPSRAKNTSRRLGGRIQNDRALPIYRTGAD